MHPIVENIKENLFKVVLSKEFYEREAVFAAAYKYEKQFSIKIEPAEPNHVVIWLQNKNINDEVNVDSFVSELIDQQLRLDIASRTNYVRNKIYEEAFRPLRTE